MWMYVRHLYKAIDAVVLVSVRTQYDIINVAMTGNVVCVSFDPAHMFRY